MTATMHLLQVRMELDRMLRARPFVSRSLRGDLSPPEVGHLLEQLDYLLRGLSECRSGRARTCPDRREDDGRTSCMALRFLGDAVERSREQGLAVSVCLSVAGTSWTAEAADRLAARYAHRVEPLHRLHEAGTHCLERLRCDERRERRARGELESVLTFAELTRGAILGMAAHLDFTWAAPLVRSSG